MNMKNTNRITLLNMASALILQGLAFLTGPIFSKMLGTDNFGIVSVYYAWVQIASIVFSLQAGGAIGVARVDFPQKDQNRYQSSVFSLATISYICFSVLTVVVVILIPDRFGLNRSMIIFGLAQGWGMYCVTLMSAKFVYEFKAGLNFILSVGVSVLTISVSIWLIYQYSAENNYWGRIIGLSSVYAVVGLFLFVYMMCTGKTGYKKEYWKYTLPITIPTVFHLLSHIVLNQSDRIMIKGLINNSEAGIYSLAANFGMVISTLWGAFNNTWSPVYIEYTKNGQIDEIKKHSRNYTMLFTVITIGFILLSREVFHLYSVDKSYWSGTDYIPFLAIGYYFVFLYSFPVNYEFYYKKTKVIAAGTLTAAILNIILNYTLIKWVGTFGAVVATVIAYGLLFLFHFICAKRIRGSVFPFSLLDFWPSLLAVCSACVLYWFTKNLWYIRWVIGAALGIYMMIKIIKRKEIF